MALWTSTDLTAEETNPPYLLYGNRADAEAGPSRWRPLLLTDAPLDRTRYSCERPQRLRADALAGSAPSSRG